MKFIYLSFIQHIIEYVPIFYIFLRDIRDSVSPVSMTTATLECVTGEFSTR